MDLNGKRLLLLGGSMWKEAIAAFAKEQGITLIATGNNRSAGIFEIADEGYEVDSTDAERMKKLIVEKKIDGVYMGGSEPVISAACQYLNELGMPCYCTKEQWEYLQNKGNFKDLCLKFGLPVVPRYTVTEENLVEVPLEAYPVITKPADGCGSSGFSVCSNVEELRLGYEKAKADSTTGTVIVEKFVRNEGVVVFLTFSNGKMYFSGLEKKYPVRYEKEGSYVAGLLTLESELTEQFRTLFEEKIATMMQAIGIQEGPVWIEVFHDNGNFYFNEVGYRYGGTVSAYPVDYFYGINQVASDIYYALTGESKISGHVSLIPTDLNRKKYYAVYPIHLNAGRITEVRGVDELRAMKNVVIIPTAKNLGDTIYQTGSFGQAYALIHVVYENKQELKDMLDRIHETLVVKDERGNNMVHRMLDPERLQEEPSFPQETHGGRNLDSKQQTLLLSETDVKAAFQEDLTVALELVEQALIKRNQNDVLLPDKISQVFDEQTQDRINCMPATLVSDKLCGMKWVAVFPGNPLTGRSNVTGTIILSELEHGFTQSIMDGTYITGLRTAAVGAVAAKYLAREDAQCIGFIGAGKEARRHLDMIKLVRPSLKTCYVSSRRNSTVEAFLAEAREKHPDMVFIHCGDDYAAAVKNADIIVTATSTQADLLKAAWIKEGAFYVHVGGWEDEYAVAQKAQKIVCDEWECVKHRTQTISRMYKEGLLTDDDIYANMGQIVSGQLSGRENDKEFIYFCSVGLAFVDVMFAKYAYEKCTEMGKGTKFALSEG